MKIDNLDSAFVDIRSASIKLGVSVQAVHALCDRGTLDFKWLGGRKFVRYENLVKLANDEKFRLRSRAISSRQLDQLAGQQVLNLERGV